MSNRVLAVSLFLIPLTAWSAGIAQVQKLLEEMQRAAHTQSYDGTFVYSQDSQLSAMRIIHSAEKDGERERLVALDSSGREVVRDRKSVTCYLPDRNAMVVEKERPPLQFPPPFPDKVEHLTPIYDFKIEEDEEKVAGQLTRKLVITPKDRYRYGHHLWVDKQTGLLLKTNLLDEQGKVIEQFMFTHIRYLEHVPDKLLQPEVDDSQLTRYEAGKMANNPQHKSTAHAWRIGELPPGFKRDLQRKHTRAEGKHPLDHLVFSDGLASISVFIESPNSAGQLQGETRMGAVNAHGYQTNGYHITAVGEVPQVTVKIVSQAVMVK